MNALQLTEGEREGGTADAWVTWRVTPALHKVLYVPIHMTFLKRQNFRDKKHPGFQKWGKGEESRDPE